MSVVPSLSPIPEPGPGRNVPRHAITVPLDVITLRSGIPESLPGRCTDISEAGVGVAVAGELAVNQHVGIEVRLPHVALPLRARAIVRHHTRLQCGLQFVNLSVEQREMIRYWAGRNAEQCKEEILPGIRVEELELQLPVTRPVKRRLWGAIRIRRQHVLVLLALTLLLTLGGWLYWQWAWRKLESPGSTATAASKKKPVYSNFSAWRNDSPRWSLADMTGSLSSCQSIRS